MSESAAAIARRTATLACCTLYPFLLSGVAPSTAAAATASKAPSFVPEEPLSSFDANRAGFATLRAGDAVAIETRALMHSDMHCGNDEAYYAPLTDVDNTVVAFTERDMFSKRGLGVTWDESGRRSAWLATFSN